MALQLTRAEKAFARMVAKALAAVSEEGHTYHGESHAPLSKFRDMAKYVYQYIADCRGIPSVGQDLKAIQFDFENIYCDPKGFEWMSEDNPDLLKLVVGFHSTLRLPFLGVYAGGDWETPITFFLYPEDKTLRAYIPKRGNLWNTDTKKAFGNGNHFDSTPDDDDVWCKKHGVESVEKLGYRADLMLAEFTDKLVKDVDKGVKLSLPD